MADPAWLKNLAQARLVGGAWTHTDPEAVRGLLAARVGDAVQALYEEAHEACEIHNEHARPERRIRVLTIAPRPGETGGGFMLLLGRCQLNLEARAHARDPRLPVLHVGVATVKGFERVVRRLRCYLPQADAFGTVAWREAPADGAEDTAAPDAAPGAAGNSLLMTNELIIKRLFEDITRALFEGGDTNGA